MCNNKLIITHYYIIIAHYDYAWHNKPGSEPALPCTYESGLN